MLMMPLPVRPAPVIVHSGSIATQITAQPFTQSYTPAATSDCVVWRVGWARNQNRTFGTATFATFTMATAVASEDNDETDRAGFAIFTITKASYIAQGGSAANWATAQTLSVSCPEGSPDSWHGFPVSLRGFGSVPAGLTAHAETSLVATKAVTVDTRGIGKRALILGGRCIGRNAAVTYTPGAGVTEEADNGANSTSFFAGRSTEADGLAPQNFSFGTTASSAAFTGDAMAAAAFVG